MTDALSVAIEARELGKSAHKRLDGINGSIDRLNSKVDVVDSKLDSVLITLARQDGANTSAKTFLDSKRWWIALLAGIAGSSAFAAVITIALRAHTG